MFKSIAAWALGLCVLGAGLLRASEIWPDLSKPTASVGSGEGDAGVVVGIEGYGFVAPVPGAESNAKDWYDHLTRARGASPGNVKLLLGVDATREEILEAAQTAAAKAAPGGTLWFVFIGHGAPGPDGKDGLLIGVDAQQKAASLQKRGLRRGEILAALTKSRAGSISVILDACFSGRGQDGTSIAPGLQPLLTVAAGGPIDPRVVVLTAAKGDQFAGPLPGANRPAFSYLVLGALRGWASGNDKRVTAGTVRRYAAEALAATLRGRNQTPDLLGKEDQVLGASTGEKGPDLGALAKATAGGGGPDFRVSNLPAVPRTQAPRALDSKTSGLDFGSVDVDALEKYDAASEFDKGEASPKEKAHSWRKLAGESPKFSVLAEKRAAEWDHFAVEWEAAEEARTRRLEARDSDWAKLSRLLALNVVEAEDKKRWSAQFAAAYLDSPGIDPEAAEILSKHAAAGPTQAALAKLAKSPPAETAGPKIPQDDQDFLKRLESSLLSELPRYPGYMKSAQIHDSWYPPECAGDKRLWAMENIRFGVLPILHTNDTPDERFGKLMRAPAYLASVFASRDRLHPSIEELKLRGAGVIVEELLLYHDNITRTPAWESKFQEILAVGELKNGKVFHERGFPEPSNRCYIGTDSKDNPWSTNIEGWLYSFWMRRHKEGTMPATLKLLRWADKLLKK